MQAVIMAAGKSTRTYPLTLTRPKPLLPVINRPLLFYNLDQLVDLVDEVVLIVGYRREMIEETLGSEYRGMRIIYQEQKEQLGTGHAVLQAAPHIRERFLVMNGDDLFAREDILRLMDFRFAALALRVEDPSQYGVIQVDEENRIVNLIEKPKEFVGNLANVGCYIFEPDIFAELERLPLSERGEIELTEAIVAIARREPVYAIPLSGYWLPTGFPWDLLSTQRYLFDHGFTPEVKGKVAESAELVWPVGVEPGAEIRPGVRIIGPAHIAKEAVIRENALILPYVSVGAGAEIGPGSLLENTIVLPGAKIAAHNLLRHSVIGAQAQIGEACHFVSSLPSGEAIRSFVKGKWIQTAHRELGAFLGDGVRLGARTVLSPGCKIWPNLVTEPGAILKEDLRPLSEADNAGE